MNQKIAVVVLTLLVVGFSAWYFDQNFVRESKQGAVSSSTKDQNQNKEDEVLITSEKLLVLDGTERVKNILEFNALGKEKQTIYSEKAEAKIKKVGSLSYLSKENPVLVSNTNGSLSLDIINIGSNEKDSNAARLIENFVNPISFCLSPQGSRLGYVAFSNTDKDYGFSLYVSSNAGKDKVKVSQNEEEISFPTFNREENKLAFMEKNASNKETIKVYDLDTKKTQTIYETKNHLFSINWAPNDVIIFSEGVVDQWKNSQIYLMSETGGDLRKIYETTGGIAIDLNVSSAGEAFAYKLITSIAQINEMAPIYATPVKGGKSIKIYSGYKVLGWVN